MFAEKGNPMRQSAVVFLTSLFCLPLCLTPGTGQAQNAAAPEMFGVREVVVEYTRFDNPKTADTCGLSRDALNTLIARTLAGTSVPAVASVDVKPPSIGMARIQLIPEISTRTDDSLNCISWVSLSAESHANVVIAPIATPRSATIVYWRQHALAAGGQSTHIQAVNIVLEKMVEQFAQQYRLDQPPELPK